MFSVQVKEVSGMGRGVFACKDFVRGEIIEICPVIPLPENLISRKRLPRILGFLEWWFFEWGKDLDQDAMVLGYGMLYNHSNDPNASYLPDLRKNLVYITATNPIKKDSEIYIDYRLPNDQIPYAFKNLPRDIKEYLRKIVQS